MGPPPTSTSAPSTSILSRSTWRTLSAGITLTAAHHVVYESFSNQAAHYMQSLDRVHRRGQAHDVTYHLLLARHTIDHFEFDRLLHKEAASRDLLGDRCAQPITRDRFLAELESA